MNKKSKILKGLLTTASLLTLTNITINQAAAADVIVTGGTIAGAAAGGVVAVDSAVGAAGINPPAAATGFGVNATIGGANIAAIGDVAGGGDGVAFATRVTMDLSATAADHNTLLNPAGGGLFIQIPSVPIAANKLDGFKVNTTTAARNINIILVPETAVGAAMKLDLGKLSSDNANLGTINIGPLSNHQFSDNLKVAAVYESNTRLALNIGVNVSGTASAIHAPAFELTIQHANDSHANSSLVLSAGIHATGNKLIVANGETAKIASVTQNAVSESKAVGFEGEGSTLLVKELILQGPQGLAAANPFPVKTAANVVMDLSTVPFLVDLGAGGFEVYDNNPTNANENTMLKLMHIKAYNSTAAATAAGGHAIGSNGTGAVAERSRVELSNDSYYFSAQGSSGAGTSGLEVQGDVIGGKKFTVAIGKGTNAGNPSNLSLALSSSGSGAGNDEAKIDVEFDNKIIYRSFNDTNVATLEGPGADTIAIRDGDKWIRANIKKEDTTAVDAAKKDSFDQLFSLRKDKKITIGTEEYSYKGGVFFNSKGKKVEAGAALTALGRLRDSLLHSGTTLVLGENVTYSKPVRSESVLTLTHHAGANNDSATREMNDVHAPFIAFQAQNAADVVVLNANKVSGYYENEPAVLMQLDPAVGGAGNASASIVAQEVNAVVYKEYNANNRKIEFKSRDHEENKVSLKYESLREGVYDGGVSSKQSIHFTAGVNQRVKATVTSEKDSYLPAVSYTGQGELHHLAELTSVAGGNDYSKIETKSSPLVLAKTLKYIARDMNHANGLVISAGSKMTNPENLVASTPVLFNTDAAAAGSSVGAYTIAPLEIVAGGKGDVTSDTAFVGYPSIQHNGKTYLKGAAAWFNDDNNQSFAAIADAALTTALDTAFGTEAVTYKFLDSQGLSAKPRKIVAMKNAAGTLVHYYKTEKGWMLYHDTAANRNYVTDADTITKLNSDNVNYVAKVKINGNIADGADVTHKSIVSDKKTIVEYLFGDVKAAAGHTHTIQLDNYGSQTAVIKEETTAADRNLNKLISSYYNKTSDVKPALSVEFTKANVGGGASNRSFYTVEANHEDKKFTVTADDAGVFAGAATATKFTFGPASNFEIKKASTNHAIDATYDLSNASGSTVKVEGSNNQIIDINMPGQGSVQLEFVDNKTTTFSNTVAGNEFKLNAAKLQTNAVNSILTWSQAVNRKISYGTTAAGGDKIDIACLEQTGDEPMNLDLLTAVTKIELPKDAIIKSPLVKLRTPILVNVKNVNLSMFSKIEPSATDKSKFVYTPVFEKYEGKDSIVYVKENLAAIEAKKDLVNIKNPNVRKVSDMVLADLTKGVGLVFQDTVMNANDSNEIFEVVEKALDLTGMKSASQTVIKDALDAASVDVDNRVDNLAQASMQMGAGSAQSQFGAWSNFSYSLGTLRAEKDSFGYKNNQWSATLGADYEVMDNVVLGLAATYSNVQIRPTEYVNETTKSLNITNKHKVMVLNGYGSADLGSGFFAKAQLSFAKLDVDSKEQKEERYKYNTTGYAAGASFGYNYKLADNTYAVPEVGFRYTNMVRYDYENASGLLKGWKNEIDSENQFFGTVGLSLKRAYQNGDTNVVPYLHAKLEQALTSGSVERTLGKADVKLELLEDGPATTKFTTGVGADIHHGAFEYGFKYGLNLKSRYTGHTGSFKVKVNL